ncbi:MAG: glutamate 5-kinase [Chloroflexi bacterium]|nr:glutamate 5-kinase [Chloroflexota bacterium]
MEDNGALPQAKAQPGAGSGPLPYSRIVVKAGTNLLTGGTDRLDLEVMASLVGQIARLRDGGAQVILVSSGAVAAGGQTLHIPRERRRDIPFRQVLAAVGQSKLMHAYEQLFAWKGIPVAQALLTRNDVSDRLRYLNTRNTLLALLGLGVVPVVNENDVVAAEELEGESFGDNDTLSALVANVVDADLLVMLSDVAGLATADPHTDREAKLVPRVERIDEAIMGLAGKSHSGRSRGGMVTKLEAARLAAASGVAVVIADGQVPDVLVRLAQGEEIGTFFAATASRLESRQRWLLSVCSRQGAIQVDTGAARALRQHDRSLLPAGVREVQGEFQRGEVVPILGPDGQRIAAGQVNYGAEELRRIQGRRSREIATILGYQYGEEVVHRSNLVPV